MKDTIVYMVMSEGDILILMIVENTALFMLELIKVKFLVKHEIDLGKLK